MVTARSADPATVVVAVALLLPIEGSVVGEETVAVLVIVLPLAAAGLTVTTSVNTELAIGIVPRVEQAIVPPLPTAGKVHDQPPGDVSDANVVPTGNVSVMDAEAATLGPALLTVIV